MDTVLLIEDEEKAHDEIYAKAYKFEDEGMECLRDYVNEHYPTLSTDSVAEETMKNDGLLKDMEHQYDATLSVLLDEADARFAEWKKLHYCMDYLPNDPELDRIIELNLERQKKENNLV